MIFNSQSVVERLPPELLVCIFIILAGVFPATRSANKTKLGWTIVTQVCRRWRTVALDACGCSVLWADTISAFPSSALKTIVRRANKASLTLDLEKLDVLSGDAIVKTLLRRAKRVRGRFFDGEPGHLWIAKLAEETRALLKHLDLVETTPNLTIAPLLAAGVELDAPFLTHCYLSRCIPMSAPGLRVLHIRAAWMCTIQDIVHYLSAFPLLEDLQLCLTQMEISPSVDEAHGLRLGNLRSFLGEGGVSSIVVLLPQLDIPPTADVSFVVQLKNHIWVQSEVDINIWRLSNDDVLVQEMGKEVRNLCEALSDSHLTSARPHDALIWDLLPPSPTYWMALTTCARAQPENHVIGENEGLGRGTIQIKLHSSSVWPFKSILPPTLTPYLSAQRIRTLYINIFETVYVSNFELDTLYGILADDVFAGVTELIIQRPARAVFSLLMCPQALQITLPLILPSLSRLVVDFGPNNWQVSERGYHSCKWIANLHAVLSHRAMLGGKLEELVLKGRRDDVESECMLEHCGRMNAESLGHLAGMVDVFVDERM